MADDDDIKNGAGAGDGAGDGGDGKGKDGAGDGGNGGAGDGKSGGKPEPQVPLSRLREEVAKREKLEKELAGKNGEVPEEEKKIRDVLTKAQREEAEAMQKAEEEITSKMDELQKVHGDFNRENLLKIIDDYGVYNEDGSIKWDKAMDLYNRLGGNPNAPGPKKKMPIANRTGDDIKKDAFDPSKKTMWEIAEDAKKELQ